MIAAMSGIPAGAGSLLGKRLGKYEILALLALGGTAEIYLARIGGAAGFEKYVVVKCLHDHLADDTEFVKMFLDEARLAAHLDHSNIVQTMELGEHEGRYYMVMEFLAGLSLAMIVRRAARAAARRPDPGAARAQHRSRRRAPGCTTRTSSATNGKPLNIVHRDISPQNLVISFEGVVKVVDFGIAKAELRETQHAVRHDQGQVRVHVARAVRGEQRRSPHRRVRARRDRARAADRTAPVQAAVAVRDVPGGDRVRRAAAVDAQPRARSGARRDRS